MDRLGEMEPACIDVMISDPPYDLIQVSRGGSPRNNVADPSSPWSAGAGAGVARGFMNQTWDGTGIAFSQEFWTRAYHVLKPGGLVRVFGGTRTFHRMCAAMEEAGFVLRPEHSLEAWAYGTGFPKSHNVAAHMDEGEAQRWVGVGTALKPAWEPIVVAYKPVG